MDMSVIVPANSDNSGSSGGAAGGGYHHNHRGAAALDGQQQQLSRYESQKRRDWNTFGQYLRNHRPPLALSRCSGAHVLEFLRYLDQFGKTKVHTHGCPFFGHPHPPAPCPCPLRQAWGSLDALIGRLRAAFEENGGTPETNPFAARAVRLYLREVRDTQAKARGIAYEKKKRKRHPPPPPAPPSDRRHPHPPVPPPALPGGAYVQLVTAGVANFQVADLNSTNGAAVLLMHNQHHGHDSSTGNGGGGGGTVMAAAESRDGSLIPLSVLN